MLHHTGRMTADNASPLSRASIWSKFWFSWNRPLLDRGRRQALTVADLYPIDEIDQSQYVREHIEALWEQEKKNCGKRKPNLARALAIDYFHSTWTSRCLIMINGLVKIGQAIFLGILLDRLENPQGYEAFIWAFAIIGCGLIAFPTKQHSFFLLYRKGNQYRAGLIATIYAKTLRLPSIRNHTTTCGRLTNLASNDVERFALTAIYTNLLLAAPVEIITILVVGVLVMGPIFCFGYALLVLVVVPLQFWLSRRFVYLRRKVAHLTDARVTLVSQAVSGARVMKLQGWEIQLEKKILEIRDREIRRLRSTSRLKACNDAIYYLSSLVVSVSVFSLYVSFGYRLTPRIVFTTFTLYNLLQYSVTKHIPNAILGCSECYVACQRIQAFLEQPDQGESTSNILADDEKKEEGDIGQSICVEISEDTTCYWDNTDIKNDPVVAFHATKSLELRSGNLYCVIGKLGSGKSAFLQALVGELAVSSGHIHIHGSKSISYAPQEPWIMDGTAQENIVMGLPFDLAWYNRVVKACCLQPDFQAFRDGDQTILGDRGVQCSGGQKSRLSLARALYCDCDVLVLDDPLSAVDSKVATTTFAEAIQELGVHRDKCVILVTHQLQFTIDDKITCVLMDKGTVACCGSFADCSSKLGSDLLHTLQSNDEYVGEEYVPTDKTAKLQPTHIESEQNPDQAFVEKRQTGVITKRTWLAYVEALGGRAVSAIFLAIFSLTQAVFLVTIFYIGRWAESSAQDTHYWFGIVFGLTTITSLLAIFRALISFYLFLRASKKLHNTMLSSVIRATVEFFDTNPLGRILNRFASDVGIVDEQLPLVIYEFGVGFIMFGGSIISAICTLPLVLVVFPFLLWAFAYYREIFVKTTRELKRLEGIGKSPIFAILSESMSGIATIRVNHKNTYFANKFESHHNVLINTQFAFIAVSRWFALKLDFLSFCFLVTATLSAVVIQHQGWLNLDSAILGLALSLLLQLASANFPYMVRQSAEVSNHMVCVERQYEFGHSIPQEAPLVTNFDVDHQDWPKEPSVAVKNVSARYRKNMPLCLSNLSFNIRPRERVGVVGRSGAGKSSLLQVLFRVLEAEEGSIVIGGVDISQLGLHKLRTNMAVITQQPVLFSGCSIRENLDPYPKSSGAEEDKRLENALRAVHMWDAISSIPNGLNGIVCEGGSNFSVGQRQLLCLARAILADSHILVLDEATANVDQATDNLLQQTLRDRFKTATIVAIAHRLESVIGFDKVLVLGNGMLLEYGAPHDLLQNPDGHFSSMVNSTGMAAALKMKVKLQAPSIT